MDKYIKQLLQLHSKVILPQLGAIVLSNEETGELMFNEYLTYDDGKIVELIRSKEDITPELAKNKVEKLIQEIQAQLDKGSSYILGDLGTFSKKDDKISFHGNLNAGGTAPAPKNVNLEEKSKVAKENVYIEKKENPTSSKDKDKKKSEDKKPTPTDKKKANKDQIKKEIAEKKKAEKEKKLKLKEERKKKKLEEKNKKKAEKERLKKEKAERKARSKEKSAAPKTKEDAKIKKVTPAASTPPPKKEEEKKSGTSANQKEKIKKDLADKKKAEKERLRIKSEEEKKRKIEEKNRKKAEKEQLKRNKNKKVVPPVKKGDKNNPEKKTDKEKQKRKPIFWILLILIILLLIGGIWVALNYEKVEAYMGWNKFENADTLKKDQANSNENDGSIPIIDSLEIAEENDSLVDNDSDSTAISTENTEAEETPDQEEEQPAHPIASSTGKYHIIVGGFAELSNAKNMVQSLSNKGFSSHMLEGTFTGLELHLVAAQSYSSLNEAKADLQRVKQEVNDGAWIKKR